MTYLGGCLCGRIHFEAEGPPIDVHYCHCSMCRRATGSAFAVLAWFDVGDVIWTRGRPRILRSSSTAERGFCAECGTPLLLRRDRENRLALMVGAFDRAAELVPTHHSGVEARLPWAHPDTTMPERRTDEQPIVDDGGIERPPPDRGVHGHPRHHRLTTGPTMHEAQGAHDAADHVKFA
jgi:hypothetical protein